MKLLIYSHFFQPSIGGVETIVLSLARGLAEIRTLDSAREFEITLVTQTSAGNADDRLLPFRVVRQPNIVRLLKLIRDADIVHVAGPALAPLILAWFAGKPSVVEHHGLQTICPNGQLLIEPSGALCDGHFMRGHYDICLWCNAGQGRVASIRLWLLTYLRRFICARIKANVMPTEWLGRQLRLPKTTHIPHGLNPISFQPRPTTTSQLPIIAFQGRLVSTKGVDLLLQAAHVLHEQRRSFKVVVIGDGPELSSLQRLTRELGIAECVQFTGRLSQHQLESTLAGATIVVVPSVGGEVFGLVVAENMRRAIPVVASDLGAFVEVLADTGRTFWTGDASDLARKLAELLDDPANARRLGELSRRRVLESYTLEHMVNQHAHLYSKLLLGEFPISPT